MIELIIIICIIVFVVKKSKNNTRTGVPNKPNIPPEPPVSQEALKQRLQEKYAGHTKQNSTNAASTYKKKEYVPQKTYVKQDILTRAASNVAEDFENEPVIKGDMPQADISKADISKKEKPKTTGLTESQIAQEAGALAEIDFYNINSVLPQPQESEMMKAVSDIMAKGIDTGISSQRDFIAEAMDWINGMTL